ncbi:hypothetical protein SCA6_019480 [Theobroma cacao]
MALQMMVMEESRNRKNAVVEGCGSFTAKLLEVEYQPYEDEMMKRRLLMLSSLPSLRRYTEMVDLPFHLAHPINSYVEANISADPKFDHIVLAAKQKIMVFLGLFLLLPVSFRLLVPPYCWKINLL